MSQLETPFGTIETDKVYVNKSSVSRYCGLEYKVIGINGHAVTIQDTRGGKPFNRTAEMFFTRYKLKA